MFEGIDLGKNPTKEDIEKHCINLFKEKWHTGYDYFSKESKVFESKEIPIEYQKNSYYTMCVLYCQELAQKACEFDYEDLDPIVRKELSTAEEKGGFCIYLSVLLYCLFSKLKVFKDEELRLVQGYYRHPMQGILSSFIEDPPDQLGLHSWITACDAVMDFSILQEESCFNFPDGAYIVEYIPEGMTLIGWEEEKKTVLQYAYDISKSSNMNYFEWIDYHMKQAAKISTEILEKMLKEMQD